MGSKPLLAGALYGSGNVDCWRNIIHGFLGDCAFLSCLTILADDVPSADGTAALEPGDMRHIRRILNADDFAATGAIRGRFCRKGEGVDVLIDGLVPVVPDPDGAGPPIPAFCHSSDCTWPWAALASA